MRKVALANLGNKGAAISEINFFSCQVLNFKVLAEHVKLDQEAAKRVKRCGWLLPTSDSQIGSSPDPGLG